MKTILLIDDHPIVREPLSRILRMLDYDVFCATDGHEALSALQEKAFDVVLLDMMLPKLDGIGFLQALRQDARWRSLPVIVVTGMVECSTLARVRELGVSNVLFKSKFTLEQLLEKIRNLCTDPPPLATVA